GQLLVGEVKAEEGDRSGKHRDAGLGVDLAGGAVQAIIINFEEVIQPAFVRLGGVGHAARADGGVGVNAALGAHAGAARADAQRERAAQRGDGVQLVEIETVEVILAFLVRVALVEEQSRGVVADARLQIDMNLPVQAQPLDAQQIGGEGKRKVELQLGDLEGGQRD